MWIHFAVLVGAIIGTDALRSDEASLLGVLYGWMPVLAGVAIAIRPATRRSLASSVAVAVTASLLMVALDISGSSRLDDTPSGAVLLEGQVQERATVAGVVKASWVRILADWAGGDLDGVDQHSGAYRDGHPRLLVVEALGEVGLLLLCFATVGIVLGACSWLSRHASFDSSANEAGARIAVAWLVCAGVMLLSQGAVANRRFDVLFGESPLWSVLLPSFGFLALGVAGFWKAAKSDDPRTANRT